MTMTAVVTLEEAIAQMVNLGESDPLTIARKIEARFGEEWTRDQAAGCFAVGHELDFAPVGVSDDGGARLPIGPFAG